MGGSAAAATAAAEVVAVAAVVRWWSLKITLGRIVTLTGHVTPVKCEEVFFASV